MGSKRATKTSSEQMQYMLDYISQNLSLITYKTNPGDNQQDLWNILTENMNELKGAMKSSEEWKRYFITWKSKTKHKARLLLCEQKKTGGGNSKIYPLNELEERLMSLIGYKTITGEDNLPPEINPDRIPNTGEINTEMFNQDILLVDGNLEITNNDIIDLHNIISTPNQFEEETNKPNNDTAVKERTPFTAPQRRRKYKSAPTMLEKSAEIYSASSDKISSSLSQVAESLKEMAEAITKYANAMLTMAEAKKMKYSRE